MRGDAVSDDVPVVVAAAPVAVDDRAIESVASPPPGFPAEGRTDDEWPPPHAVSVNVSPRADAIARDGIRMCLQTRPMKDEYGNASTAERRQWQRRGAQGVETAGFVRDARG